MTSEMLRPLEGRPYLKAWQQRMADLAKAVTKPAKPRKKGRKKAKR